jgi:hypothetical protein
MSIQEFVNNTARDADIQAVNRLEAELDQETNKLRAISHDVLTKKFAEVNHPQENASMIQEGFRRLSVLIRWGGLAVSLYVLAWDAWGIYVSGPQAFDPVLLYVAGFVVPGVAGWALAWLIDGFVQKNP